MGKKIDPLKLLNILASIATIAGFIKSLFNL
jgi:hypothetical protein